MGMLDGIGAFASGFGPAFSGAMQNSERMALQEKELAMRQAAEQRAAAQQEFMLRKYMEAEQRDRQAAGLYAGMLGIKPTAVDDAKVNEMDPSRPDLIWKNGGNSSEYVDALTKPDPRYEQLLAGGSKAAADLVKQTREQQMAELKARTDAWKEANAQRMADIKDKQIMAMISRAGSPQESRQPVVYINDAGQPVWGTIGEARGRVAGNLSPDVAGAKASAVAGGTARGKREYNMEGVGDVIENARTLLNTNPTASGVGAMADRAAALIGVSTPGSVPAQELKQLAGFLTSKMPRMEGPQSDKDVMLYREMAGMVGDDTIPVARRLAALNSLERIVSKYDRASPQGAAQPRVRTFNPQTGRLE